MNKTKMIVAFALGGFVLSFIIGLVSSVSFGAVVLRALLSAAIFVGVYCAFSFVFSKYLAESSPKEDISGLNIPAKGQMVDINLDGDLLPDDENGPAFKIPRELMPERNTMNQQVQVEEDEVAVVTTENVVPSSVEPEEKLFSAQQKTENMNDDAELGALPDMDSMLSSIQQPVGEVITNSDFATSGDTVSSEALRGADTEVMAKAIHTVLSQSKE